MQQNKPYAEEIDILLRQAGFVQAEILHKNSVFAAFGAVKPGAHNQSLQT